MYLVPRGERAARRRRGAAPRLRAIFARDRRADSSEDFGISPTVGVPQLHEAGAGGHANSRWNMLHRPSRRRSLRTQLLRRRRTDRRATD